MNYVSGTAQELGRHLRALGQYRHRVFVQRLGWSLPEATDDLEWDGFDRPDTVHVLATDDTGSIHGCARLLPTTRPYLLAQVFPQLLDGARPPAVEHMWELSRFAAVSLDGSAPARGTLDTVQSLALLAATMDVAARRGACDLVSVSPVGIQRILRKGGYAFSCLGSPQLIEGQRLFACSLPLRPERQALVED
ncbi:acyl-homoserine-lactone synthase [Pseudorhodoferax soli]|uniref:Acyl-homoserine-lactone synthase n=1 Tax=Pseudorhodoferax soli TaxID=545864 RepID=A0A368XGG8_9BURK|nr:acyl-homoserine-lactone synthase [Pseudorhodoferax soli]RCW65104.1 acyl homoserine lactone synthase [Pseudorhodoferax soli]